jgi:hypothetical protein
MLVATDTTFSIGAESMTTSSSASYWPIPFLVSESRTSSVSAWLADSPAACQLTAKFEEHSQT